MPTNTNAYNSRVTDESLEKRFRDTFRSQGGAELVDDLYAQGVIVPVVDFTAAATGQQLAQNLQTAWDFSTGSAVVTNGSSTLITNSGFWLVDLNFISDGLADASAQQIAQLQISDGSASKTIWSINRVIGTPGEAFALQDNEFVVFLRANDSLIAATASTSHTINVSYRQIATVNGDLVNPTGFTSS
jgi:hypothetical protein